MWRREAGLSALAALALYACVYLVPGTNAAIGTLSTIERIRSSDLSQLELLDQELRHGDPAGSTGSVLDRGGPNLLDGFVPTRRDQL